MHRNISARSYPARGMKLQKIVLTTFRRLGDGGVDLQLIDWDYIRTNQSILRTYVTMLHLKTEIVQGCHLRLVRAVKQHETKLLAHPNL